jgi:hypothetical protein
LEGFKPSKRCHQLFNINHLIIIFEYLCKVFQGAKDRIARYITLQLHHSQYNHWATMHLYPVLSKQPHDNGLDTIFLIKNEQNVLIFIKNHFYEKN